MLTLRGGSSTNWLVRPKRILRLKETRYLFAIWSGNKPYLPSRPAHAFSSAVPWTRPHISYSSVVRGRIYSLVLLQVAAGGIQALKGVFHSKSGSSGGVCCSSQ